MTDLGVDGKLLYQGQPDVTETTLVTVTEGKKWTLLFIELCNVTTSSATIALSHVESGESGGNTNRFLDLTLEAKTTLPYECWKPMATGHFLSAIQGTTGAITVSAYGTEVTI